MMIPLESVRWPDLLLLVEDFLLDLLDLLTMRLSKLSDVVMREAELRRKLASVSFPRAISAFN